VTQRVSVTLPYLRNCLRASPTEPQGGHLPPKSNIIDMHCVREPRHCLRASDTRQDRLFVSQISGHCQAASYGVCYDRPRFAWSNGGFGEGCFAGHNMRALAAIVVTSGLIGGLFIWPFSARYMDGLEQRVADTRARYYAYPIAAGTVASSSAYTDDDGYHRFTVRFRFDVAGASYSRTQTWYLEHLPQSISRSDEVQKYTPGTSVQVHYNPDRPADAVVDPKRINVAEISTDWESILRSLAIPAVAVGCICVWCWACKRRERSVVRGV
jgi:hypothetical protein